MALTMEPPVRGASNSADQPEQRIGQVDPDSVLHAYDIAVVFGVLMDVHAAKQAEEGNPKYKKYKAPCWHGGESDNEGNEVEDRSQSRETSNDNGIDLPQ